MVIVGLDGVHQGVAAIYALFVFEFIKNANTKINFYKNSPTFEEKVWSDKIKSVFCNKFRLVFVK